MLSYDLHTHSLVSDGTLSPTELVERAGAAGVDVLALTDHDDTAGCGEAMAAAARVGLELLPGVEISVTWSGLTVHIVGLRVDPVAEGLETGLARQREFRNWRAEEMGRRLARHGIAGAFEAAREMAQGRIVSRSHFARFLVDSGHARDVRDVFRHFLKHNKPGHVPGNWATLDEATGWIHAAGGTAVIAHPARYALTATRLRRLIGEFVECGGEAIEVVSGSHSADEARTMAAHAKSAGLYASAGSDYHGPNHSWAELGRLSPLPAGCTPVWEAWSPTDEAAVAGS